MKKEDFMKIKVNGRRSGKTEKMKVVISEALESGQEVYIGIDFASGKDKTVKTKIIK